MKISILVPRQLKHESIYSINKTLPLGACYVGTVLKNKGYEVEVIDDFLTPIHIDKIDSDIILISFMTNSANKAYSMADHFRKQGKRVILGGPHASTMPNEAAEHADHVVVGEGENVIVDIIEGKRTEKIIVSDKIEDLDSLPFPDYSIIKSVKGEPPITMISTSRGCPFDCKFCSVIAIHGRKYRFRSPENVLKELKQRHPIRRYLFFSDDNFSANKERAKEILKGMIKNNTIPRGWGTQVRVDVALDEELLSLMEKTNCKLLYIGFESVNNETLKEYNKNQDLDDIKRCVKAIHAHGIDIFGMFVAGSDHDTKESIREIATFCNEMNIRISQITSYTPLPGTRLYKELSAEDRIITHNWEYYDLQHVVHRPKLMTPYELQVELFDALRRIHSPKKLFKYALKDPIWSISTAYLAFKTRSWERQKDDYLKFLKSLEK